MSNLFDLGFEDACARDLQRWSFLLDGSSKRTRNLCDRVSLYYWFGWLSPSLWNFWSKFWFFECSFSNEGRRYRATPNFPARFRSSDIIEFGSDKKVRHLFFFNNTKSRFGFKPNHFYTNRFWFLKIIRFVSNRRRLGWKWSGKLRNRRGRMRVTINYFRQLEISKNRPCD